MPRVHGNNLPYTVQWYAHMGAWRIWVHCEYNRHRSYMMKPYISSWYEYFRFWVLKRNREKKKYLFWNKAYLRTFFRLSTLKWHKLYIPFPCTTRTRLSNLTSIMAGDVQAKPSISKSGIALVNVEYSGLMIKMFNLNTTLPFRSTIYYKYKARNWPYSRNITYRSYRGSRVPWFVTNMFM